MSTCCPTVQLPLGVFNQSINQSLKPQSRWGQTRCSDRQDHRGGGVGVFVRPILEGRLALREVGFLQVGSDLMGRCRILRPRVRLEVSHDLRVRVGLEPESPVVVRLRCRVDVVQPRRGEALRSPRRKYHTQNIEPSAPKPWKSCMPKSVCACSLKTKVKLVNNWNRLTSCWNGWD